MPAAVQCGSGSWGADVPFARSSALARDRGRRRLGLDRVFARFNGGGIARQMPDQRIAQRVLDQRGMHTRRQFLGSELGKRPREQGFVQRCPAAQIESA